MDNDDRALVIIFLFFLAIVLAGASISISADYREFKYDKPRYIVHTDMGDYYAKSCYIERGTLHFTMVDNSEYSTSSYFVEAIPGAEPQTIRYVHTGRWILMLIDRLVSRN